MSNILLEHFDQYVNSVYVEQDIPNEINEDILIYIKNPSENVMLELMNYYKFSFDDFTELPKSVIRKYVLMNNNVQLFEKYVELFSQTEIYELSKINPYFIKYLNKLCVSHAFIIELLTKDIYCIEQLEDIANYVNYVMFSVVRYFKLKSEYKISQSAKFPKINWEKYMKTDEWYSLICTLITAGEIYQIPVQYIDENQLVLGIKNCKHLDEIEKYVTLVLNSRCDLDDKLIYDTLFDLNMFSIDHIPQTYQTSEMICKVLPEINKFNSQILKFLKKIPEVEQKIIELCNIEDIPYYLHNMEICLKAIHNNPDSIAHINPKFIDDSILTAYFKHDIMRDIPRIERFSIISQFEENRIIKILQYRPMLISHLTNEQRSYNVLKSMVTSTGYSLQYLTHEEMIYNNGEFVQIALANEPNAKKYLSSIVLIKN